MSSSKTKSKDAKNAGYPAQGKPEAATDAIKPIEGLKEQVKSKKEETGYVGGRISMKQMKLYLAYSAPGQKRAIKSLCGALDQHKKKKAA